MNKWIYLTCIVVTLFSGSCRKGGAPGAAPAGITNTALAVGNTTDISVSGSLIAFRVSESQHFNTNLNGNSVGGSHNDADASDKVVAVYGTNTQVATNLYLAGSDPGNMLFVSNLLVFTVNEAAEGNVPLDSDGSVSDEDIIYFLNLSNGSKINTTQTATKGTIWGDDNVLAYRLQNGNLGWLRIATPSTVHDSGVALIANPVPGQDILVGNNFIVFRDSSGVPRVIDSVSVSSPVTLGGGLVAYSGSMHLIGEKLIFLQAEGASAKNGDADTTDFFPTLIDLSQAILGASGMTSLSIEADPTTWHVDDASNRIAFLREEAESGGAGNDWNGDSDVTDSVLFWIDVEDFSNPQNTQLAGRELVLSGTNIAVSVPEGEQNGSTGGFSGDLNGDTDVGLDRVVFLLDTTSAPATVYNLGLDGESLAMGSDVLAFGVNEALQGEDLNGDGLASAGAIISHAVEIQFRTIRNLHWQADTIVAVGQRAFFRVPEGQYGFGDLNGDGDQGDSVLAFFDIDRTEGTMTGATVLRSGFFGVYQNDSLFVFLTDESDLNRDLNGDSDTSDRVLRFLKFQ